MQGNEKEIRLLKLQMALREEEEYRDMPHNARKWAFEEVRHCPSADDFASGRLQEMDLASVKSEMRARENVKTIFEALSSRDDTQTESTQRERDLETMRKIKDPMKRLAFARKKKLT